MPTTTSYRGDSVGKESPERIDPDRAAIGEQLQKMDPAPLAEAVKNSDGTVAVAEIALVAAHEGR